MSGFMREAEQAFDGNNNNNDNSGNQQQDSYNQNQQQDSYNQNQQQDQSGNQQSGNNQSNRSGGGGFMGTLKTGSEDAAINTELNKFANKEGLPQGADGAMDAFVDQEANKYI